MNLLLFVKNLETKLVRKILRSFSDRLQVEVTAIEESKDVDTLMVEELIGSLQTFEMNMKQYKGEKSVSLKAAQVEENDDGNEDMSE